MKLIIAAVMLMTPVAASAQNLPLCKAIGEFAGAAMSARQTGQITQTQALGAIPANSPSREIASTIIRIAYLTPLYKTSYDKANATVVFQNEMEINCLDSTSK